MKQTRLSKEEVKTLVNDYLEGMPVIDIANKYKISRVAVFYNLRKTDTRRTRNRPSRTGNDNKHYLYSTWSGMKQRCFNPKNDMYHLYGAKGVSICDRWKNDYWLFYEDMGDRPEGKTLDRIDTYGNYEPSNCRWATIQQQNRNLKVRHNAASGYKYVYVYKGKNNFKSYHLRRPIDNKRYQKTFQSEQEAICVKVLLEDTEWWNEELIKGVEL